MAVLVTLVVLALACAMQMTAYPHDGSFQKRTNITLTQWKEVTMPGKGVVLKETLEVRAYVRKPSSDITALDVQSVAKLANNKVLAAKSQKGGLENVVNPKMNVQSSDISVNETIIALIGPKPPTNVLIFVQFKRIGDDTHL